MIIGQRVNVFYRGSFYGGEISKIIRENKSFIVNFEAPSYDEITKTQTKKYYPHNVLYTKEELRSVI